MALSRSPGYRVRQVGTLAVGGLADPVAEPALGVPSSDAEPALGVPSSDAAVTPIALPAAAAAPPAAPERPHRWRVAARRSPGLVAVAALGVAGTVGFGTAWGLGDHTSTPTAAVTTSARNLVLALTNFDPGTIRADFSQIQSDATGQFAAQARRFFGASIRKELTSAGAASRGRVDDLYVQSVNGDRATVFAVVSQKYLNKDATTPVNDTLRLVVGMTDVGGTWKTSSVQVLQQPQPIAAPIGGASGSGSGTGSHHGTAKSKTS